MLGALNWTVTWFRPEGEQSAAAVAETIVDYLIRGLSPQKRSARRTRAA